MASLMFAGSWLRETKGRKARQSRERSASQSSTPTYSLPNNPLDSLLLNLVILCSMGKVKQWTKTMRTTRRGQSEEDDEPEVDEPIPLKTVSSCFSAMSVANAGIALGGMAGGQLAVGVKGASTWPQREVDDARVAPRDRPTLGSVQSLDASGFHISLRIRRTVACRVDE